MNDKEIAAKRAYEAVQAKARELRQAVQTWRETFLALGENEAVTREMAESEGLASLFEVQAMLIEPLAFVSELAKIMSRVLARFPSGKDLVLQAHEEGEHRAAMSCPCTEHAKQRREAQALVDRVAS